MSGSTVQIAAEDGGSFEAYLATPSGSTKRPGLVILPEIYNSNHWVRAVADQYAGDGYVCIAPDVFWRQQPGRYLQYTPEDQQVGRALSAAMDLGRFTADMRACVNFLKARPDCTGKVGSVGYCLGGKLVYLAAARKLIDAGVTYYAVQLNNHYDEAKNIDGPLLMHFGELDTRVPPDMYAEIGKQLAGKSNVTIHYYLGADHGFNRFGYPPFDEAAAALAKQRSLEFLKKHLI
jgi:carboxymethylenebutenolidase